MKIADAPYMEETLVSLRANPLIRDNMDNLKLDFEGVYSATLDLDLELEENQLSKIKTDLFCAFCQGAFVATDLESNYRKNFNLPAEMKAELEERAKKGVQKIIMPDKEIKKPDLVLP